MGRMLKDEFLDCLDEKTFSRVLRRIPAEDREQFKVWYENLHAGGVNGLGKKSIHELLLKLALFIYLSDMQGVLYPRVPDPKDELDRRNIEIANRRHHGSKSYI